MILGQLIGKQLLRQNSSFTTSSNTFRFFHYTSTFRLTWLNLLTHTRNISHLGQISQRSTNLVWLEHPSILIVERTSSSWNQRISLIWLWLSTFVLIRQELWRRVSSRSLRYSLMGRFTDLRRTRWNSVNSSLKFGSAKWMRMKRKTIRSYFRQVLKGNRKVSRTWWTFSTTILVLVNR
jgi:hypothetical protein